MVELVMGLVTPQAPPSLLHASLSTLAAATDTNPPALQALQGREEELLALTMEPHTLLTGVTAAVVVLHLHSSSMFASPALLTPVLEAVSLALSSSPTSTLATLQLGEEEEGGEGEEEVGVREAKDILKAQHTALEVLANL